MGQDRRNVASKPFAAALNAPQPAVALFLQRCLDNNSTCRGMAQ